MKLSISSVDRSTAFNYLAALIMAIVVVLLFTPFWHFGEGDAAEAVSINSYVWYPGEQGALESYLAEELGEKVDINQVILAPILLLVCGFVGALLCILKADKPAVALLPLITGVSGIVGFSTVPALQLGSTWVLMLVLCIALVALAVISVVQYISMQKHA